MVMAQVLFIMKRKEAKKNEKGAPFVALDRSNVVSYHDSIVIYKRVKEGLRRAYYSESKNEQTLLEVFMMGVLTKLCCF